MCVNGWMDTSHGCRGQRSHLSPSPWTMRLNQVIRAAYQVFASRVMSQALIQVFDRALLAMYRHAALLSHTQNGTVETV